MMLYIDIVLVYREYCAHIQLISINAIDIFGLCLCVAFEKPSHRIIILVEFGILWDATRTVFGNISTARIERIIFFGENK